MNNNPSDLTPIISPILALLKSRKVIIAILTALVDALVIGVPSLLPVRDQLLAVLTTLGLSLIGTTAAEDVSKQHNEAKIEVARHAATATVAAAHVMALKVPPDAGADGDTRPMPPVSGSTLH